MLETKKIRSKKTLKKEAVKPEPQMEENQNVEVTTE